MNLLEEIKTNRKIIKLGRKLINEDYPTIKEGEKILEEYEGLVESINNSKIKEKFVEMDYYLGSLLEDNWILGYRPID